MKISTLLGLEDKMSPVLSKVEQQTIRNVKEFQRLEKETQDYINIAKHLEEAGLGDSKMMDGLTDAIASNMKGMNELADGTRNVNDELKNQENILPSVITSLISWRAIIGGIKNLIGMSDVATQTNARLGLIAKEGESAELLGEHIYQAAQRARVGYNDFASTVTKIGMQAGDAFKGNGELIKFTENLNKIFATSGLDANSISSVMYNLTQSLSTGQLLGNDYRILKMNAPEFIKMLRDTYANGSQQVLDEMVSKGQISAKMLKQVVLDNTDEIEEKFKAMPITWEQAWTKFSNTMQRLLTPVLKVLGEIAEGLDTVFTFLADHQYILVLVGIALAAILVPILAYNTYVAISAFVTKILDAALGGLYLKFVLLVAIILIVVGVMIYLWNTSEEAAEGILLIGDVAIMTFKTIAVGIKTIFFGLAALVSMILEAILYSIQEFVKLSLGPLNLVLGALQMLGAPVAPIEVTFADEFHNVASKWRDETGEELMGDWAGIDSEIKARDATRKYRAENRKKIGVKDPIKELVDKSNDLITTDDNGNPAINTTSGDSLLSEEDTQLLLDIATRDFKLNYQSLTPQISLTFGDIRETADAHSIAEIIINEVAESVAGNMEVATV